MNSVVLKVCSVLRTILISACVIHLSIGNSQSLQNRQNDGEESVPAAESATNSPNAETNLPSLEQVLDHVVRNKESPQFTVKQRQSQSPTENSPTENSSPETGSDRVPDSSGPAEHSINSLTTGAQEFANTFHANAEKVEVLVTPIDHRLRLKQCERELTYSWTSNTKTTGNTSISVRCEGSAPWRVLVRVSVGVYYRIPVLAIPANKGDFLRPDMVTMRLLDVSTLRQEALRSIEKVVGYRFKRRLATGREISSSILAAPKVVNKGDIVLISTSNQLLDVQMKGTAMTGGEIGRQVKVRSISSGRVIQTMVKGPGQVVVSP